MIESLAEHGVQAEDLVPALMTTHSVKNPEYDPRAAKEAELEREKLEGGGDEEAPPPPYELGVQTLDASAPSLLQAAVPLSQDDSADKRGGGMTPTESESPLPNFVPRSRSRSVNPFGDDEDEEDGLPPTLRRSLSKDIPQSIASSSSRMTSSPPPETKTKVINPFGDDEEDDDTLPPVASSSRITVPAMSGDRASVSRIPSFDMDDDDGDIGRPASPIRKEPNSHGTPRSITPQKGNIDEGEDVESKREEEEDPDPERTPTRKHSPLPLDQDSRMKESLEVEKAGEDEDDEAAPLPSLPGVSTSLTSADENVVLDIRWTVVCPPAKVFLSTLC